MLWAQPPQRNRVNGLFFLLVICAINFSPFQAKKSPVKTYTIDDGLGGDQINRIVQRDTQRVMDMNGQDLRLWSDEAIELIGEPWCNL